VGAIHRPSAFAPHRQLLANLLVLTLFTVQATVFGTAWWTVWKGKPSARGWGIAASVINILISLPIIYLSRSVRGIGVVLAIGVAGLVAFWRRYEEPTSAATIQKDLRIPGDGTNDLVNKTAPLLLCLVSRPDEVAPAGRLFHAARGKYHLHYTEIALAPLGPIASAALLQGKLTGRLPDVLASAMQGLDTDAQRALQFVRSTPGVTTALVGMRSRAHAEENLAVARRPPASADDYLRLFTPGDA